VAKPGSTSNTYVSRGGDKLAAALDHFDLNANGLACADLGSHVGGFVDCLLQRGARQVFSVDTAYGLLAWKLRKDPRVIVLERTNAMHVVLPGPVDLVTIDAGWTRQEKLLPNAMKLLGSTAERCGRIISLIKPHYEVDRSQLAKGVLRDELFDAVTRDVLQGIEGLRLTVCGTMESPIRGHAGNREMLVLLELEGRRCVGSL
jgi:23S rRNA (cytidine1920-2'-O)/16S rRNA (cytidine1409-2'-O)-methyltransferase